MTKTAFIYYSKSKKAYIATKVLHKAPKKAYKKDLILLEIIPDFNYTKQQLVMTPKEAVIIANALLHAVVIFNNKKKRK